MLLLFHLPFVFQKFVQIFILSVLTFILYKCIQKMYLLCLFSNYYSGCNSKFLCSMCLLELETCPLDLHQGLLRVGLDANAGGKDWALSEGATEVSGDGKTQKWVLIRKDRCDSEPRQRELAFFLWSLWSSHRLGNFKLSVHLEILQV